MIIQRFLSTFKAFKFFPTFANDKSPRPGPNLNQDFSQIMTSLEKKQIQSTGRPWRAEQLRLKSNQDLHKLWFVCVKQKNILLADQVIEKKFSQVRVLHHRIKKVSLTMKRILTVVQERQKIKKEYRKKLQDEYIQKKREQLRKKINSQEQKIPQITWQMLRAKYLQLRRGVDNTKYLQRMWQKKQNMQARKTKMYQRLKNNKLKNFKSFWDYQMSIGERPLQQQILRSHVRNWKSLNLKQRKIILGFLNARRARDAKTAFINELKILGDKIAQDQVKSRIQASKKQ